MGAGFGIGQGVVVMPEVKAAGGSHSLELMARNVLMLRVGAMSQIHLGAVDRHTRS